jgi:hypothetical protein
MEKNENSEGCGYSGGYMGQSDPMPMPMNCPSNLYPGSDIEYYINLFKKEAEMKKEKMMKQREYDHMRMNRL